MGLFGGRKNKGKATGAPPTVGYFGKHPSAGDFLRHNASSPELLALDEWLSSALAAGPRTLLDSWETAFSSAPALRFLSSQGEGRCLLGVLIPSQDRSGRQFPLIIFAELDSEQMISSYSASPHEPFLRRAQDVLDRRNSLSWEELRSAALELEPPDGHSLLEARQQHDGHLDGTALGDALTAMFGADGDQPNRALTAVELVASSAELDSLPSYGIRCPLSPEAPGAAGLWLSLLGRSVPTLLPSFLWNDDALLFYYGSLPPRALAAALDPEWQDDSVCDLKTTTTTASGEPAPREITLRSLLDRTTS